MLQTLNQSWWLYLLRGIAAIIFGVLAFISPSATLLALVLIFGIYAFVDGALAVVASFRMRETVNRWWVVLLEGLAGIIVGVIAMVDPQITAFALLFLIAVWAIFTGILEIVEAVRLRREMSNEWALILGGILSVILGVILFASPAAGVLGLIWAIGAYAILFGVMMLLLAFRVRGIARRIPI